MNRVLLVDDEQHYRTATRALLRNQFHVLLAQNGKEALKTLSQEHIDLCLLDYRLPDIDGDELLERIRQHHPHIPVIFITGHPSRALEKKITRPPYNADAFMYKPPDPFLLLEIMDELIENNKKAQKAIDAGQADSAAGRKECSIERKKRLFDMIELLKEKPWTLGELHIKFNRSTSQLYRDIQELIDLGFPIESSQNGYSLQKKTREK